MLTNADHAKECLALAEDAWAAGNQVDAAYYNARAQVYATLALANSYADSR
jgi:hypothetical protein